MYKIYTKKFWKYDVYDNIKYRIQRCTRGYSNADLWSVDHFLGELIVRVLKDFKKDIRKIGGYPTFCGSKAKSISEEEYDEKAEQLWLNEIQDMIDGFDYLVKSDDHLFLYMDEYEKGTYKTRDEAIQTADIEYKKAEKKAMKFIKYFRHLWT